MKSKTIFFNEEQLLTRDSGINSEIFLKLSTEEKKKYLTLYSIYNHLLIQFFIKNFDLKNFDNELLNNKSGYMSIKEEDMDIYQYSSSSFLKYFYIRNNIYIERLKNEEINYLLNIYSNGNLDLTEESEIFIQDTYLRVILEDYQNQPYNILYGPDNGKFLKPSNAIVIGVRYDDFYKKDNEDDITGKKDIILEYVN